MKHERSKFVHLRKGEQFLSESDMFIIVSFRKDEDIEAAHEKNGARLADA